MTTSGNIGVPNEPADDLEMFYRERGIKSREEKIQSLERQFQMPAYHSMPRERRLEELEKMARHIFKGSDLHTLDSAKQRKKYRDLYAQVNDSPIPGSENANVLSPVAQAMMGGRIKIERG